MARTVPEEFFIVHFFDTDFGLAVENNVLVEVMGVLIISDSVIIISESW